MSSEKTLVREKEALAVSFAEEKSARLKVESELELERGKCTELKKQVDNLQSNYALAQKGLAAGKAAVEDALKRLDKLMSERNKLREENDSLAAETLSLGGDRARLLDVCERMRRQMENRDQHLGRYAGDVMCDIQRPQDHQSSWHGVDLSRYDRQSAGMRSEATGGVGGGEREKAGYVMVSDSVVARELEETKTLLAMGGVNATLPSEGFRENSAATPTFLRVTPSKSQPLEGQGGGRALPTYIAPPREELERRNLVRVELGKKTGQLKIVVEMVVEVVKESAALVESFSRLKGGSDNSKVLALEKSCFSLLDANSRIALQMQRMGLDLQRVYRRFKALEMGTAGGGGREGGKGRRKNDDFEQNGAGGMNEVSQGH